MNYRDVLEKQLSEYRSYVDLLKKRIDIIDRDLTDRWVADEYSLTGGYIIPCGKSVYDMNEAQILKTKTLKEISIQERIIAEKEKYFKEYIVEFEKDWAITSANFADLWMRAMLSTNEVVKKILKTVDIAVVEAEPEKKIGLYKSLKKQLG